MADGYIGLFKVPDKGVAKVILTGNPTVQVVEDNIQFNRSTGGISNAKITISDIDVTAGTITAVVVAYAEYDATPANMEWSKKATPVTIDIGDNQIVDVIIEGLKVTPPNGTKYNFKVWFLNSDSQYAYNGTDDIEEDSHYLSITEFVFDGIDDIAQIYEVTDLICTSKGVSNGEGDETTPVPLNSNLIKIQWTDMKTHESTHRLEDVGSGVIDRVSGSKHYWIYGQMISTYIVYMFISATGDAPDNHFPTPNAQESKGTWEKMLETTDTSCEIEIPENAKVSLWVGYTYKGHVDDIGV